MSTLVDAVIGSDAPSILPRSSSLAPRSSSVAPRQRTRPASSRGRAPSESIGAHSDAEGFPDDEVVGARGNTKRPRDPAGDIPKLTDVPGDRVADSFEDFLENYDEDPNSSGHPLSSATSGKKYYILQIEALKRYQLSTLYVDFRHVMRYPALKEAIQEQYYRFQPYMVRALNNLIAKYEPEYYRQHRQPNSTSASNGSTSMANDYTQDESITSRTPNQQTDKIFTLAFYNLPLVSRVRQLRTAQVGQLLSISGTVTRTSEVRPELSSATFVCEICQTIVANIEQTFRYTEPTQCPNLTCGNREGWRLDIRQSTFVDWQKVRIQENSSEIPTGSMPRTMDVILRGEMVDRSKAGEKCIFTGTLIVIPDVSQFRVPGTRVQATRDTGNQTRGADAGGSGVSGLKALGVRDLTYRMAFMACMVLPDTSTQGQRPGQVDGHAASVLAGLNQTSMSAENEDDSTDAQQKAYLATLTKSEIDDLRKMVHTDNIFRRIIDSIAPTVYGHSIIKEGLFLQLLGGVSKTTPEGMALRGDINICIVGDPSTSKSQFLKYICSFLPRSVYTSGKASSAAGLTAAVVKDEETGEFTIEAGALMLADNGICAIDEFDKMDIADQVAIHEAMEQQTISIAKAGIQATLNARTSILAAANPVGGRYNMKTTLRANINMSAPIMSRFDLFFVVLDQCEESVDRNLAKHIVDVHMLRDEAITPEFSTEQLQRYIRFAKTFKPEFTEEAKAALVARYKELRANDAQGGIGRNSYRITVRQLESMIRLSEAIAKANCVSEITVDFVREAHHLLKQSIIHVEKDEVEVEEDDDEDDDADGVGSAEALTAEAAEEAADADMADEPVATAANTVKRAKTKITHDDYMAIVTAMVHRVNADQADEEDGVEEEELLDWYMEQREAELETTAQAEEVLSLAKKVLKRMVKDNILMQIRGEGIANEEGGGLESTRILYVIHPNCAIEEVG